MAGKCLTDEPYHSSLAAGYPDRVNLSETETITISNISMTINYPQNISLTPGSDYTVVSSVCSGEGLSIDIVSPRSGSTYRVRPSGNTSSIITSGSGDMTLNATQLNQTWDAEHLQYRFIVTELKDYHYENIDNSPDKRARIGRESPSVSSIA